MIEAGQLYVRIEQCFPVRYQRGIQQSKIRNVSQNNLMNPQIVRQRGL